MTDTQRPALDGTPVPIIHVTQEDLAEIRKSLEAQNTGDRRLEILRRKLRRSPLAALRAISEENAELRQDVEQLEKNLAYLHDIIRKIGRAIKGETDLPPEVVQEFERIRGMDATAGRPWPGDA